MSDIRTSYSAIAKFEGSWYNAYCELDALSQNTLNKMESMARSAKIKEDKLSNQIYNAKMMLDAAKSKERAYESDAAGYQLEYDRCCARVDYVYDHPIKVSRTDSDGNTHTYTEVDQAALRAAQNSRDIALSKLRRAEEKLNNVRNLISDINREIGFFEDLKKAIEYMYRLIKEDIYEAKKYVMAIKEESVYNMARIKDVMEKADKYLSSMRLWRATKIWLAELPNAVK